MNDKQWDDYIRRQPGTFFGEMGRQHDEAHRMSTSYTPYPSATSVPRRTSVRAGRPGPTGPGVLDGAADGVAGLAHWFTQRIWPLRLLERLGRWLMRRGWRANLPLAGAGAFLGAGMVAPSSAMIAAAIGALAGWFALRIVGGTLIAAIALTGLAVALGLIGVVLWLGYRLLAGLSG